MRPATTRDIARLIELMKGFYAESGYVLDEPHAREAFAALLADPRLGRVWMIEGAAGDAGYVVVTFAFGMEYGGLMAAVDDLYLQPAARNQGLGTAALAEVRDFCVAQGIRGITVEVAADNGAARTAYERTGFVANDHLLMTMRLAPPTHVE